MYNSEQYTSYAFRTVNNYRKTSYTKVSKKKYNQIIHGFNKIKFYTMKKLRNYPQPQPNPEEKQHFPAEQQLPLVARGTGEFVAHWWSLRCGAQLL